MTDNQSGKKSLKELENQHWAEHWGSRNWRSWGSWFSWGSPVGLGLFFIEIGLAVAIFVYTFRG